MAPSCNSRGQVKRIGNQECPNKKENLFVKKISRTQKRKELLYAKMCQVSLYYWIDQINYYVFLYDELGEKPSEFLKIFSVPRRTHKR